MPPMDRSSLFQLVDRATDGRLEELLRNWAAAGVSRRAAAALLAQELGGIEISSETVRRWMANALADDDNGDEAAA